MDWLKQLLKNLPLEAISEILAQVVVRWIKLIEPISEENLSLYTYVGASLLVLFCMYWLLKIFPKALRGALWLMSAAVLLTPGQAIGELGNAPAIIGVVHGLLMGEVALAAMAFLPILAMMIIGLVLGALWQFLYAALKSHRKTAPQV